MRLGWPMLATLMALGLSYAASPYITLYRIGAAIRGHDRATLEALVDWHHVREGIKEDICDLVIDDPAPRTAAARDPAALPPFGASFIHGIASTAIDRAVTPQALLAVPSGAAARPARASSPMAQPIAAARLGWAFFDSPTVFSVDLHADGQAQPVRLRMVLHHGTWQVDRVWLPAALLSDRGDRT